MTNDFDGVVSSKTTLVAWHAWHETGEREHRDRVLLSLAPLVKYIVFKKVRELPPHCDVEDLISCGIEALIGSIERFDPERGRTLEQFAWGRIHGAVLDELRRQDWAPRSLRRWQRKIGRARSEFERANGRPPLHDELAEKTGMSSRMLSRREQQFQAVDITSLNVPVAATGDATLERIDTLACSDPDLDPERRAVTLDVKERFREAFDRLPARQREVAVLLYVEDLTLREAGDVLGVSESRVCQIHSELKRTLRDELEPVAELAAA